MATKTNQYCDYCGKLLVEDKKRVNYVYGIFIEAGYSNGGWGQRKDFIPRTSVEICRECYLPIEAKIHELRLLIYDLKK